MKKYLEILLCVLLLAVLYSVAYADFEGYMIINPDRNLFTDEKLSGIMGHFEEQSIVYAKNKGGINMYEVLFTTVGEVGGTEYTKAYVVIAEPKVLSAAKAAEYRQILESRGAHKVDGIPLPSAEVNPEPAEQPDKYGTIQMSGTAVITVSETNIRKGPDKNENTYGVYTKNTELPVYGYVDKNGMIWYKVREPENNNIGFIMSDYVSLKEETVVADETAGKIIASENDGSKMMLMMASNNISTGIPMRYTSGSGELDTPPTINKTTFNLGETLVVTYPNCNPGDKLQVTFGTSGIGYQIFDEFTETVSGTTGVVRIALDPEKGYFPSDTYIIHVMRIDNNGFGKEGYSENITIIIGNMDNEEEIRVLKYTPVIQYGEPYRISFIPAKDIDYYDISLFIKDGDKYSCISGSLNFINLGMLHDNEPYHAVKYSFDKHLTSKTSGEGKISIHGLDNPSGTSTRYTNVELDVLIVDSAITGSFNSTAYSATIGEQVQAIGNVKTTGSPIERITVKVEGYWPDGPESDDNRYATTTFSTDDVYEGQLNFSIDTTKEPFNVPGTYTMNLWASCKDGTYGKLDTVQVVVSEKADDNQVIPAFSLTNLSYTTTNAPVTVSWDQATFPVISGYHGSYVVGWYGPGLPNEGKAFTTTDTSYSIPAELTGQPGSYAVDVYAVMIDDTGNIAIDANGNAVQRLANGDNVIELRHANPFLTTPVLSPDVVWAGDPAIISVATNDQVAYLKSVNNNGYVSDVKFDAKAENGRITWTRTTVPEATDTGRTWTCIAYNAAGEEIGRSDPSNPITVYSKPTVVASPSVTKKGETITFTVFAPGKSGTVKLETVYNGTVYPVGDQQTLNANGQAAITHSFSSAGENREIRAYINGEYFGSVYVTVNADSETKQEEEQPAVNPVPAQPAVNPAPAQPAVNPIPQESKIEPQVTVEPTMPPITINEKISYDEATDTYYVKGDLRIPAELSNNDLAGKNIKVEGNVTIEGSVSGLNSISCNELLVAGNGQLNGNFGTVECKNLTVRNGGIVRNINKLCAAGNVYNYGTIDMPGGVLTGNIQFGITTLDIQIYDNAVFKVKEVNARRLGMRNNVETIPFALNYCDKLGVSSSVRILSDLALSDLSVDNNSVLIGNKINSREALINGTVRSESGGVKFNKMTVVGDSNVAADSIEASYAEIKSNGQLKIYNKQSALSTLKIDNSLKIEDGGKLTTKLLNYATRDPFPYGRDKFEGKLQVEAIKIVGEYDRDNKLVGVKYDTGALQKEDIITNKAELDGVLQNAKYTLENFVKTGNFYVSGIPVPIKYDAVNNKVKINSSELIKYTARDIDKDKLISEYKIKHNISDNNAEDELKKLGSVSVINYNKNDKKALEMKCAAVSMLNDLVENAGGYRFFNFFDVMNLQDATVNQDYLGYRYVKNSYASFGLGQSFGSGTITIEDVKTKKKYDVVVSTDLDTLKEIAFETIASGTSAAQDYFKEALSEMVDECFNMTIGAFGEEISEIYTKQKERGGIYNVSLNDPNKVKFNTGAGSVNIDLNNTIMLRDVYAMYQGYSELIGLGNKFKDTYEQKLQAYSK